MDRGYRMGPPIPVRQDAVVWLHGAKGASLFILNDLLGNRNLSRGLHSMLVLDKSAG